MTVTAGRQRHFDSDGGFADSPRRPSRVITVVMVTFRSPVTLHTTDVAEATDLIARLYIPTRLTPVGRGRLNLRMNAIELPALTAGILHFGAGIVVHAAEVGHYFVNIPLSGWAVNRWMDGMSETTTVRSAAVFSPGTSATVTWSGDCEQLCIKVARSEMHRQLEALLNRPVRSSLRFARRLELATPKAKNWFGLVRILANEAGRDDGMLAHPLAVENLQHLLIQGLLLIQPHNYTEAFDTNERAAGAKVVKRAVELMHADPERAWNTAELAREVGVGMRALQRAFQQSDLPPPMTYLRRLRLYRVRAELACGGVDTARVATVAGRWGFLHMGRFAEQYRELFGESPSETLRDENTRRFDDGVVSVARHAGIQFASR
jgi:AraC-like DNA-binding protein